LNGKGEGPDGKGTANRRPFLCKRALRRAEALQKSPSDSKPWKVRGLFSQKRGFFYETSDDLCGHFYPDFGGG